ncbi:protein-L-isoaspartate O-methyltransferase [Streptomyces carpaticus]|uniref:protein-L-isoaspartate O-methyltransferase family protein n=1 Tax=Streptomyces carpaticus TaxID=285558 RepID=UPI0031F78388
MTATATDWAPRARALADELRAKGALSSDVVADAIASVPRHLFVTGHYAHGQHTTVDPAQPTDEHLSVIYRDIGVMTHTPSDKAGGYSSTSQPSIVAKMLEAAHLTPGMRVLEIGAGTGWNAALIAHITGAPVHTVEASDLVAAEAREALTRASADHVTVHSADGYTGHPADGPYDLITVTCGIAGIPTGWLDQLAPGGTILAPIALGGTHPLTRVHATPDGAAGQLVTMADFMAARGPLYADATPSPATAGTALAAPTPTHAVHFPDPLERPAYIDLWMYLATHDPRTTCAGAQGTTEYTGCAVVQDRDTVVYVQPTGIHPTPAATDLAAQTLDRIAAWTNAGRPPMSTWRAPLVPGGDPSAPLLVPHWTS